jgi:hypothetical protein
MTENAPFKSWTFAMTALSSFESTISPASFGTVLQLPVSPRANEAEQRKRRFFRYLIGPLAIELARLSKR